MTWEVIRLVDAAPIPAELRRQVVLFGTRTREAIADRNEEKLTFAGELPANIRRGDTVADDGTVTKATAVTVDRTEEIRTAARLHARNVALHMNAQWLFTADGSARNLGSEQSPSVTRRRWANAWYWLFCPLVAIETILDSTDTDWTPDVAVMALNAYRALVPNDPERIEFWYRGHTVGTWVGYRTALASDAGRAQVWFNWERGGAIPAFASDARGSSQWNGTATRLNATIPLNATSVAEALV